MIRQPLGVVCVFLVLILTAALPPVLARDISPAREPADDERQRSTQPAQPTSEGPDAILAIDPMSLTTPVTDAQTLEVVPWPEYPFDDFGSTSVSYFCTAATASDGSFDDPLQQPLTGCSSNGSLGLFPGQVECGSYPINNCPN